MSSSLVTLSLLAIAWSVDPADHGFGTDLPTSDRSPAHQPDVDRHEFEMSETGAHDVSMAREAGEDWEDFVYPSDYEDDEKQPASCSICYASRATVMHECGLDYCDDCFSCSDWN
jgi:hypothetical protein